MSAACSLGLPSATVNRPWIRRIRLPPRFPLASLRHLCKTPGGRWEGAIPAQPTFTIGLSLWKRSAEHDLLIAAGTGVFKPSWCLNEMSRSFAIGLETVTRIVVAFQPCSKGNFGNCRAMIQADSRSYLISHGPLKCNTPDPNDEVVADQNRSTCNRRRELATNFGELGGASRRFCRFRELETFYGSNQSSGFTKVCRLPFDFSTSHHSRVRGGTRRECGDYNELNVNKFGVILHVSKRLLKPAIYRGAIQTVMSPENRRPRSAYFLQLPVLVFGLARVAPTSRDADRSTGSHQFHRSLADVSFAVLDGDQVSPFLGYRSCSQPPHHNFDAVRNRRPSASLIQVCFYSYYDVGNLLSLMWLS